MFMARPPRLLLPALLLGAALLPGPAIALSWDLGNDWSDTMNPFGPWALESGALVLPSHVDAWQGLIGDFATAQPAWTTRDDVLSSLPTFFRSSAAMNIVHDWQAGDVVCHSQDDFNGAGFGPARVVWTSPIHGTVNVSGAVWMGRDIGRANHWSLSVRGAVVSEGDLSSGDPWSRATPFDFAAGSGGAAALAGIDVEVGDEIVLLVQRTTAAGDYVGMRVHVDATQALDVAPAAEPRFSLALTSPNPSATGASFVLRQSGAVPVTVAIVGIDGRVVRTLCEGPRPAGPCAIAWDGCDATGRRARPGCYWCLARSASGTRALRIVLLH